MYLTEHFFGKGIKYILCPRRLSTCSPALIRMRNKFLQSWGWSWYQRVNVEVQGEARASLLAGGERGSRSGWEDRPRLWVKGLKHHRRRRESRGEVRLPTAHCGDDDSGSWGHGSEMGDRRAGGFVTVWVRGAWGEGPF